MSSDNCHSQKLQRQSNSHQDLSDFTKQRMNNTEAGDFEIANNENVTALHHHDSIIPTLGAERFLTSDADCLIHGNPEIFNIKRGNGSSSFSNIMTTVASKEDEFDDENGFKSKRKFTSTLVESEHDINKIRNYDIDSVHLSLFNGVTVESQLAKGIVTTNKPMYKPTCLSSIRSLEVLEDELNQPSVVQRNQRNNVLSENVPKEANISGGDRSSSPQCSPKIRPPHDNKDIKADSTTLLVMSSNDITNEEVTWTSSTPLISSKSTIIKRDCTLSLPTRYTNSNTSNHSKSTLSSTKHPKTSSRTSSTSSGSVRVNPSHFNASISSTTSSAITGVTRNIDVTLLRTIGVRMSKCGSQRLAIYVSHLPEQRGSEETSDGVIMPPTIPRNTPLSNNIGGKPVPNVHKIFELAALAAKSRQSSVSTITSIIGDKKGTSEATSLSSMNEDAYPPIWVRFTSSEIERIVTGIYKGRARREELYPSISHELLIDNSVSTSDQPTKSGHIPFNTLCKAQRYQSLYLSSDLREAGLFNGAIITTLYFQISDPPDRPLENFRLAIAWTSLDSLTEFLDTEVVYGPSEIHPLCLQSHKWIPFVLEKTIEWNGEYNFVVEMSKDESHSSFSWPATGSIYMHTTQEIRSVGHKDNNDSSGRYPFISWQKPIRFRKVPALAFEVDAPQCVKIVAHMPPHVFENTLVSVAMSLDGKKFTSDCAQVFVREMDSSAIAGLVSDFAKLLSQNAFADVIFHVGRKLGDEVTFLAHQVILASRCKVLQERIFSLRESVDHNSQIMEVEVASTRPLIFSHILRFFYTAEVEIDMEVCCELFKCADEYRLEGLKQSCELFLKNHTTITNITAILLSSIQWDVPDYMLWHFDAVSVTPGFAKDIVGMHDLMRDILIARSRFLTRRGIEGSKMVSGTPGGGEYCTGDREMDSVVNDVATFTAAFLEDMEALLTGDASSSLKSSNKEDINDTPLFDIRFEVGGDIGVPVHFSAHKSILSTRSEVFAAMFSSKMREAGEGIVKVPNISPEVFRCVLQFLYTGTSDMSTTNIFELYRAADQYVLAELKDKAEEYIQQEITIDNVAHFLVAADRWNLSNIRSFCLQLTIEDFNEVSITPSFLDQVVASRSLMLELLHARMGEPTV